VTYLKFSVVQEDDGRIFLICKITSLSSTAKRLTGRSTPAQTPPTSPANDQTPPVEPLHSRDCSPAHGPHKQCAGPGRHRPTGWHHWPRHHRRPFATPSPPAPPTGKIAAIDAGHKSPGDPCSRWPAGRLAARAHRPGWAPHPQPQRPPAVL